MQSDKLCRESRRKPFGELATFGICAPFQRLCQWMSQLFTTLFLGTTCATPPSTFADAGPMQ